MLSALNLHEVFNSVEGKLDNHSEESDHIEIEPEDEELDFEIIHTNHSEDEQEKEDLKDEENDRQSYYSKSSENDLVLSTEHNYDNFKKSDEIIDLTKSESFEMMNNNEFLEDLTSDFEDLKLNKANKF